MRNAWKIDDLRKKILFTLVILLLYRLGNAVPVPYVDIDALGQYFNQMQNTVLGLLNVMSGGAFSNATIFALSIQPYINASIIIQLLTIAIPALERMSKEEGEEGKKKIASITRYTTVAIGLIQGFAYYYMIMKSGFLTADGSGIWAAIVIILTFTSGSALIMWLGEQITEFGIGNGISIILFASIVSRFPTSLYQMVTNAVNGTVAWWIDILLLLGALAMIVLIVLINDSERRIPVQYAKRVVGRKMYGGQSTHLPMKVNMSGVLPIIFAQSIASLPATIAAFTGHSDSAWASTTSIPYAIIYFLLIIFFAYFYSTIQFNPVEVANNLKKNGGYIPGFRPGKPTSEFIKKVLNKITLFGAIYLGIIAVVPILISHFSTTADLSGISLGGTSIIIVVGVALETVRALEAQLLMRNYKGFLSCYKRCNMKLILLGAPGAGKGTQAEILSKMLSIPTISTGNILRAAMKNGTPVGLQAKAYVDSGRLVPDDVIIGIINERLAEPDCVNGYILDGVPRTIPQAEALESAGSDIDCAISLEVADEVIIERMSGRRTCKECSQTFHIVSNPPKTEGICDFCGGELTVRKDDAPETVKARLETYHRETEPLKAFYESRGKLKSIENQPSIEATTEAIKKALGI